MPDSARNTSMEEGHATRYISLFSGIECAVRGVDFQENQPGMGENVGERGLNPSKCPNCGGKTRVLETRVSKGGLRRRRICMRKECKLRFSTKETFPEIY